MKVLLIHPPDSRASIAPGRFEPLALEVLAATIPDHLVKVLDLRLEKLQHLGRILKEFNPDVTGISVNNTIHVNAARNVLKRIRVASPHIYQAVGGHHPTILPHDFHLPSVDAIFFGWAEKSFPAWIEAISNGLTGENIEGIQLLENGRPHTYRENNWDLQAMDIPFPRRDLIEKYSRYYRSDLGYRTALVNTTRGCMNRCRFCSVWKAANGHFLFRSPDDIVYEIASQPKNVHKVFFADDNTFINPQNALELSRLIRESGIRKKYSGYCRSDTIVKYPEIIQEWKNIGLDNLCVGFEGTDNSLLEKVNKNNRIVQNEEAARILNEKGIPFRPHFLIDPCFEKKDFQNLLQYVRRNQLRSPVFPILTPIPGSDHYQEVKDKIHLDYDFFDYAHAVVPTKMSPKEFYKCWISLFRRSYPVASNLARSVRKILRKRTSYPQSIQKHHHLNLIHLTILQVLSIALEFKIRRHYKWLETSR